MDFIMAVTVKQDQVGGRVVVLIAVPVEGFDVILLLLASCGHEYF